MDRITEEQLVELEKIYDFGFGTGARLIAEIRRLRRIAIDAVRVGNIHVASGHGERYLPQACESGHDELISFIDEEMW